MTHGKKGFTLVELMVVVIIVGILASVAIPIMSNSAARAKKTEAITGLGLIRTAARMYHIERSDWPAELDDLSAYISTTDLNGKYYSGSNYSITSNVAKATNATLGDVNMDIVTGAVTGY